MKPVKKWNRWEIVYRVPGYRTPFSEHFDTKEEADVRIAEITLAKRLGTLKPPVKTKKTGCLTLGDFLDEYVDKYGANKWGDSYYSVNLHRINDYIKPLIGSLLLKDITARDIDDYYTRLLTTPAVVLKGHRDATKTVSYSVIEKIDDLLRSAFNQAVKWEYIPKNPALAATVPKAPAKRREVWSPAVSADRDQRLYGSEFEGLPSFGYRLLNACRGNTGLAVVCGQHFRRDAEKKYICSSGQAGAEALR